MASLEDLSGRFFEFKLDKLEEDIDCLKRALFKFCKSGKKSDAFSVYYCFCEIFNVFGPGYGSMKRLLEFLSDHEYHSGGLLTKHRDHYSHSVYVFALGLAIYAGDGGFRNIFKDFYKSEKADDTFFLRFWGLTALFHDIGYPFQLAHEQIKTYVQVMWGEDSHNPSVAFEDMESLLNPCGSVSAGDLLVTEINRRLGYPENVLRGLITERYRHQRHFMDHGYFSALLLCRKLLETGTQITDAVTDVLTAIALHNNLNRYDIKRELGTDVSVPAKKHPVAYLLILCDELQDWDRKAFGAVSKKDPLAWKVEAEIGGGVINITYVFDSFSVVDTVEADGDGKKKIKTISRLNLNAAKVLNGKFTAELDTLVTGGLKVVAAAREEKKNKAVKNFASSESFINLCDFAEAIHRSYQSVYGGEDFDELTLEFKLSNIEQAKSYADKLELINCFYSDKELDYPVVTGFVKESYDGGGKRDDLGFLAREEHLRWVREKLNAGWKYGTDYTTKAERDAKKIHRDIIPFDCLDEDTRKKDELMVENMVPFLYHYGHGVRIYSYRGGRKPVLNIAGCGHRTAAMHNGNLKEQIKDVLRGYMKDYRVIVSTNFAFGADQLIAECAYELGITIKAALPLPYEDYIASIREDAKKYCYAFTAEDELRMRHLLALTVSCKVVPDKNYIYLEASKHIINKCNKLIALWDGVETILQDEHGNPINQGGTWHNICIAKNSRGLKDADIHIIKCER